MKGYALSSNGEGITSKNLDNIRQYIGMADITTTSKIAHPPNAKPHHLKFQQHEEGPAAAYLTHEAETSSAGSSPLSHVTMITTMHGKNH